jgi:hypothetical protein
VPNLIRGCGAKVPLMVRLRPVSPSSWLGAQVLPLRPQLPLDYLHRGPPARRPLTTPKQGTEEGPIATRVANRGRAHTLRMRNPPPWGEAWGCESPGVWGPEGY